MKPLIAATLVSAGLAHDAGAQAMRVYIGTYTQAASRGIYVADYDADTGALSEPRLAAEAVNPAFLTTHPSGDFLYAVSESGEKDGKPVSGLSAFRIDHRTGDLELLNQESSEGQGPCHLTVDPQGRYLFVANYTSGSVAALPIADDGRLGPATSVVEHEGASIHPKRQQGPHAHGIYVVTPNPEGADGSEHLFVWAVDLGLDQVLCYRFDPATGSLAANDPPHAATQPGAGPRHLAFDPDGRFAYVINELDNTVSVFSHDAAAGELRPVQTITTLPEDFKDVSYTAEVWVHPSGRWLYGSNRGHDSIVIYDIDPDNGRLTLAAHHPSGGAAPRHFQADPANRFMLVPNQNGDVIATLAMDAESGGLTATGRQTRISKPVCTIFVPIP